MMLKSYSIAGINIIQGVPRGGCLYEADLHKKKLMWPWPDFGDATQGQTDKISKLIFFNPTTLVW